MNDCPAPREGSPLEPNKCYLTCSVNEIYNHGLDENCQIPAQGEFEHGFNGYHSHRLDNEDENCSGRVIHNYSRVEIAEVVEEYSDYEEDYEEVVDEYIEEEEVIEYEEEEVTPTEPEEETYDDNIADEPIVEIEENDATAEPAEETDTVEYEEEITIEEATGNGIDLSENQFFDVSVTKLLFKVVNMSLLFQQYQDQLDQNRKYTYNYNIGYTEVDEFQHSQEEAEAIAAAEEAANQLAYGNLLAGYTSEEPVAAEDFLTVESNQNLIDAVAASTFPEIVETETAFVPETELPSFLRRAYQDANANNDARTRLQEQNQQEQE